MNSLDTAQKIHFIGIGGIGMSALARYCLATGKHVSGSDVVDSILTRELEGEGVIISIGHNENNISHNVEMIVYTQAIPAGNIEIKSAKKRGIPIFSYAQAVGLLTKEKYTIAVAGTHGKSTTTAMIAILMIQAGLDPTVIIGTRMKELNDSNFRFGKSSFLLIEACEYKRSFLEYYPHIIVLPNVDLDHLDYFKNEADYVLAFKQFVKKIPDTGFLIANGDDAHIKSILPVVKGDILATHFESESFEMEGRSFLYPKLQVPGMHNKKNAALSFIVGLVLDVGENSIRESLGNFAGTWRRFEKMGRIQTGALCYNDYGHHPTEIKATLAGARERYPDKKIICVFQPHQYSRTFQLLKEFGSSFPDADSVIIPNIYEVRDTEEDKKNVNVDLLVTEIKKHHQHVVNGGGIEKTARYLLTHTTKDDVIITMGAGDIGIIYVFLPAK